MSVLTVTAPPSFAAKWLVPLLPSFLSAETNVDVRVDLTDGVLEIENGEADVAIRYSNGMWDNCLSTQLLPVEKFFPVCCPSLLNANPLLASPAGLVDQTLIRDVTMKNPSYPGWPEWFQHAGYKEHKHAHFLEVNASLSAIEMALLGQGVALAREHLVHNELADGRLISLYPDKSLSTGWSYYILRSKNSCRHAEVFANWFSSSLKAAYSK